MISKLNEKSYIIKDQLDDMDAFFFLEEDGDHHICGIEYYERYCDSDESFEIYKFRRISPTIWLRSSDSALLSSRAAKKLESIYQRWLAGVCVDELLAKD